MKYTIYDTVTGDIKLVLVCSVRDIGLNLATGESFIEGVGDAKTQEVRVSDRTIVPLSQEKLQARETYKQQRDAVVAAREGEKVRVRETLEELPASPIKTILTFILKEMGVG